MVSILVGELQQVFIQQQKLVDEFLADNDALALERIDVASAERLDIVTAVSSLPLLCDKKMVIVGSLKDRQDLQEAMEVFLSAITDQVHLIITEPGISKGTSYQKTLASQPGYVEYKSRQAAELRRWLVSYSQELGSKLEPRDADFLIDRLGENNMTLATELTKLSVYPEINREIISQLVEPTPRSRIFDLLDAVAKGDQERAIRFYDDQRMQKVEPLQILAMIIWQVQLILLAKRSKRSLDQVASDAGVSAYPLKKASSIARNISAFQLKQLLQACINTEKQIRLDFVNPDASLKFLIAKTCLVGA